MPDTDGRQNTSLPSKESLGPVQIAGTVVVVIGIAMIFSDRFPS